MAYIPPPPPPPPKREDPPRRKKKNKSSIKITINGKEINDIEDIPEGITISIEGDEPAVDAACMMTDSLGAKKLLINTEAKTLYHASAVVACNYLVTLQGLALEMMDKAGVSGKDAIDVLYPLIKGTLSNIENIGIEKALTGPVARGDAETVQRHISEIKEKMPEFIKLYKTLGLYTVDIALTGGSISENTATELKKILS